MKSEAVVADMLLDMLLEERAARAAERVRYEQQIHQLETRLNLILAVAEAKKAYDH